MNDPQKAVRTLALAEKLRDIPTLSIVVTSIMELVNNPKTSAAQVAEVLKRDQVLTAKLLRTINSSFYSMATPITDVPKALGFLGFNTLSAIVLSTSVFSSFEIRSAPFFNVLDFWRHSLGCGLASELLAKTVRYPKPEEAFTCGLLHDLGKIALFQISKDDMKAVTDKCKLENISFLDAEMAIGLPGHTVLGEKLGEQWKLPVVIRKTIRFHHRDVLEMESIAPNQKTAIILASLGNIMIKRIGFGSSGDNQKPEYPESYVKHLTLDAEKMTELEERMKIEADRAQGFLDAVT